METFSNQRICSQAVLAILLPTTDEAFRSVQAQNPFRRIYPFEAEARLNVI
jgi:hypothetical protein